MTDFFQHPNALVESDRIGAGTRIWAFAHVLSGAVIGADCNVCDHVFIENDVTVGDRVTIKCGVQLWNGVRLENDVFVGPNVTFTNDPMPRSKRHLEKHPETLVKQGASLGANAAILPGITIGRHAMIGAGAVVTRSVPPYALVVGSPARIVRYIDAERPYRRLLAELDTGKFHAVLDRRVWLIAGLTALFVYGTELTSFSLSIDEELHAFRGQEIWVDWLKQGRWGMALLTFLFPPWSATPFLPTLIFCAGLVASAVLLAEQLAENRREAIAFAVMFVSCPIWPHVGEFNTFSWGVGIGLVTCALAFWLARMGGLDAILWSGALLAFSIAIYQSLLLLFVVAGLLYYASADSDRFSSRRSLVGLCGGCLTGVVAYYLVLQASLIARGVELTYVQHWIKISELLAPEDRGRQRAVEKLFGLVFGGDPIYLGWGGVALSLAWIGFLALVWRLAVKRNAAPLIRLTAAAALAVAAVAALSPAIISAGRAPARTLLALPVLYAVLSAIPFRFRFRFDSALPALLSFCVLVNAWIATSLFYSDRLARERDAVLAAGLIPRIEATGRPRFGDSIPVVVVGAWSSPEAGPYHRVEIFGTSFFEQGGGNVGRIVSYLRIIGLKDARPASLTSIADSLETVHAMPAWPASGSVAVVDKAVVVKFGDLTAQQTLRLQR